MKLRSAQRYPLDRPLPPGVSGGSSAVFRYRQYPVFSWPWLVRRTLLCVVLVTGWALLNGVTVAVTGRLWLGVQVWVYQFCAFMLMCTMGPALATALRHRHLPVRHERWLLVAAILFGMVLSIAVDSFASARVAGIFLQIPSFNQADAALQFTDAGEVWVVVINALFALLVYATLGGGWALRVWFSEQRRWEQSRQQKHIAQLEMEKQQATLRLSALQARIEPHFLFNTLASVRGQISSDPAAAEAMLDAITAYLRASIPQMRDGDGALYCTLGQQLDMCASYLELMRLRLGERLDYRIDADEELRRLEYPALLLITLVENAIKHGIEPKPGTGEIILRAVRDGDSLEVTVLDNGAGLQAGMGGGVGLSTVRAQLATQFGERASLKLFTAPDGTHAVLRTPLEMTDD